jgi:U3 small nucleolar RNA-associated protein 6
MKTKREYSGVKRIMALFKRATTKFKGDIALWLQYIDYAKKSNSRNILSVIFTQ